MQRRGLGSFAQGLPTPSGIQGASQGPCQGIYGQQLTQGTHPYHTSSVGSQSQSASRSAGISGYTSTTYSPTSYDAPNAHGVPPEEFYGLLIDAHGRPSEMFSRMADALFFVMDRQCEVGELRNTGVIEPVKYIWFCMKLGLDQQGATLLLALLPTFYDMAGVPCRYVQSTNGQIAVLDRRAWLHTAVFEARAAPQEAYTNWSRAINTFNLHDPATDLPFPLPLPRTALPLMPDFQLSAAYQSWRTQAIIKSSQMQAQATAAAIMSTYRSPSLFGYRRQSSFGMLSSFGGGHGAQISGTSNAEGGNDRATWLDATTAVAQLANTILGVATGTGGIPGLS